jgi:hypothetical protein
MAQQRRAWAQPGFVTYNQAQELGGNVRKGEHGTKVYFVKQLEVKDKDSEELRRVLMLREYTVFNVAQCESLPKHIIEPEAKAPRNKMHATRWLMSSLPLRGPTSAKAQAKPTMHQGKISSRCQASMRSATPIASMALPSMS